MIRFGPSGIPLSCKGRTLRDGIEDVHNLGLTAMEVQLVRVNLVERYAGEEDIGKTLRTLPNELAVQIGRRGETREARITGLDTPIQRGDVIYGLASGIARDYAELEELGAIARELDIEMSLHAPYYMDLANADGLAAKSVDAVKWGGLLADAMNALVVVTHIGLYGSLAPEAALAQVTDNVRALRDWYRDARLRPALGLEASGRQEVIGSLDEILSIARAVRGVRPILNFAHVHARENGLLKQPSDFAGVLDRVREFVDDRYYVHFSGVEHEGGNELRYTPIKKGDLRFEPLAELMMDDGRDLTIISSSPLLEHDAMYMKVIYERVLAKKLTRPPPAREMLEKELVRPPPVPRAAEPVRPPRRAAATKGTRRTAPKARPKARPPARPPARPKARPRAKGRSRGGRARKRPTGRRPPKKGTSRGRR